MNINFEKFKTTSLDRKQMKSVLGGTGVKCKCKEGKGTWYGNYSSADALRSAVRNNCNSAGAMCGQTDKDDSDDVG